MPTIQGALQHAAAILEKARDLSAQPDARYLLAKAISKDLAFLLAHPELEIEPGDWKRFQEWIDLRAKGKPIAYLIGRQEFYGRDFIVSPAVLIPRPETELLIEQGLKILARPDTSAHQDARTGRLGNISTTLPGWIADIGTGSGCIAVTLAAELPHARIVATDISESALGVARENARIHGVEERIQFHHVDLLPRGLARLDAIFSNPPYVATGHGRLAAEVREHEPKEALFAGESGVKFYERIVPLAARCLKPGGWLILELGYGGEERVRALFEVVRWPSVQVFPDLQGIARCLIARIT